MTGFYFIGGQSDSRRSRFPWRLRCKTLWIIHLPQANNAAMADPRIIEVRLDERSIIRRNADIEQERQVAIFDLLEANHFAPTGHEGPFRILLRIEDDRLAIDLHDEANALLETVRVSLARFRRLIRNYFAICESYFKAVHDQSHRQIETVDMARRGLHNQGAELLRDCLDGKIEVDFDTARQLFTLICVLHIK